MKVIQCCVAILWFLLCSSVQATPVLQINGSGKLTGATGVSVGSAIYTVNFAEGTCAEVFGACDLAHFNFTTEASAMAASAALLNDVFVGEFDTSPGLTFGCDIGVTLCGPSTPYRLLTFDVGPGWGSSVALNYDLEEYDRVSYTGAEFATSSSTYFNAGNWTFAVWTQTSTVPIPGTITLLCLGLVALNCGRRKQT